jgi:hypothetical protein
LLWPTYLRGAPSWRFVYDKTLALRSPGDWRPLPFSPFSRGGGGIKEHLVYAAK